MSLQLQKGSFEDFKKGGDLSGMVFTFRILNSNLSPTMHSSDGQPLKSRALDRIEAFDIIREKLKDGRTVVRTIRYIEGEPSIYKDEQSPDKDIPKKKHYLTFPKGVKIVSGADSQLLQFMMLTNYNASNPDRIVNDTTPALFELVDTKKIIAQNMAKDELIEDARYFCRKGDWAEVKAYARVLNVPLHADPAEIRWHLRSIAEKDPGKFMAGLKDPLMRKKHYVLEGIDEGYLILNKQNNSIAWANNPYEPLDVAGMDKDVVDSLVRKFTTETGRLHYEALLDLLKPVDNKNFNLPPPTAEDLAAIKSTAKPVPGIWAAEESDEELTAFVDEAILRNIVVFKKPMWYVYQGENYQKKEGLVTALKSEEQLLGSLKKDLLKSREAQ